MGTGMNTRIYPFTLCGWEWEKILISVGFRYGDELKYKKVKRNNNV